jgi:hypothetical protein
MDSRMWWAVTVIILVGLASMAWGAPPPDADLGGPLHAWFERQHNVRGGWCCDLADGHVLSDDDWRQSGDRYEVRVTDAWLPVPSEALRDTVGGPNPTGHAIVWFTANEFGVRIYCFAPGTEY